MLNQEIKNKFKVPFFHLFLGSLVSQTTDLQHDLGNLETVLFKSKISSVSVQKPIYVTSLARSGTTILLEILGSHPEKKNYMKDSIQIKNRLHFNDILNY